MHKVYPIIGDRIKEYRKNAKINQSELSKFCGISRTTLSNIESGKQRVTIDLLYMIASKLDVRIYDLIPADPDTEIDAISAPRVSDSIAFVGIIDEAKKRVKE